MVERGKGCQAAYFRPCYPTTERGVSELNAFALGFLIWQKEGGYFASESCWKDSSA